MNLHLHRAHITGIKSSTRQSDQCSLTFTCVSCHSRMTPLSEWIARCAKTLWNDITSRFQSVTILWTPIPAKRKQAWFAIAPWKKLLCDNLLYNCILFISIFLMISVNRVIINSVRSFIVSCASCPAIFGCIILEYEVVSTLLTGNVIAGGPVVQIFACVTLIRDWRPYINSSRRILWKIQAAGTLVLMCRS